VLTLPLTFWGYWLFGLSAMSVGSVRKKANFQSGAILMLHIVRSQHLNDEDDPKKKERQTYWENNL